MFVIVLCKYNSNSEPLRPCISWFPSSRDHRVDRRPGRVCGSRERTVRRSPAALLGAAAAMGRGAPQRKWESGCAWRARPVLDLALSAFSREPCGAGSGRHGSAAGGRRVHPRLCSRKGRAGRARPDVPQVLWMRARAPLASSRISRGWCLREAGVGGRDWPPVSDGGCHYSSRSGWVFLLGAWAACLLAIGSPCPQPVYTDAHVSFSGLLRLSSPAFRKQFYQCWPGAHEGAGVQELEVTWLFYKP